MGTLNNVAIGSIVLNMVENVPSTISGATLHNIVDNERINAQNITGDTINSDIPEKYQPAMISLTAAGVVNLMELTGADAKNIKLGDFNISKGGQSNTAISSQKLREDGITKLNNLGYVFNYSKALGWQQKMEQRGVLMDMF